MAIDLRLIDKLLADYKKPEDIIGENGLLKQLTKALLERAMQAEMTEHLGYEKHDPAGNNSGNSRNGVSAKTLKGEFGEMPLETPRDRNGSDEPKIVAKGQTRWTGFDDKIISMYSRGMSAREIQRAFGRDVPSGGESAVDFQCHRSGDGRGQDLAEPAAGCGGSDRVPGRVGGEDSRGRPRAQQGDLRGHWREPAGDQRGAGAVGEPYGHKRRRREVLAAVLTELKNRGVNEVSIVCVDGLKGFPEAIETVFPEAQ